MRRHLLAASFASLVGLAAAYCGQAFLAATAATVMPACSNAEAGLLPPLTGINILADSLTAGRGCGTGKGQVYKYAAYVGIPADNPGSFDAGTDGTGEPFEYLTWGVYDCFTDGIFAFLCTYGDAGGGVGAGTYFVKVYAFNADDWNSAFPQPLPDGGSVEVPVSLDVTAVNPPSVPQPPAACTGSQLRAPSALPAALARSTWATTCTATQQANVSVLAQCAPLEPGTITP